MRGTSVLTAHGQSARLLALRGLLLLLTVTASLSTAHGGSAHAQQAHQTPQNRCVDYGSFGVVDAYPPPRRGEPIMAQPFQPCADLPGQPQPQIYIDAQVQVGGSQNAGGGENAGGGQVPGGGTPGGGGGWRPRFGFHGLNPY
jgi:uncharacterized membrane protein YgcG